ncbi:hypothetical protein ACFQHV_23175 [Promicromonospora thailandica]|uniref:Uncharacterized protein n=1 Tax=Promicromonospora thailandica TaxID=765201 RepID=A0A9X2FYA3_9MICO|nr:hypothetical protein [Promicromonospora thailandica]MCP2263527.1 hypothetical protein [Promicromonospora thailandica]BFF19291.1 hypothetical protein GCM10025730_28120 [Promicromonospora thailandica]
MSATRRKGSRGGRAASRAGGPPASNALTWAESLASGESAPGASALEWAEGLAAKEPAPSPWGSAGAAAPVTPPSPAEGDGGSPWGPIPAPAVADPAEDGDANPWGSVAATEPALPRGRGKNAGGKSGKSGKSGGRSGKSRAKGKGARSGAKGAPKSGADVAPTPAGGFPLNIGPVTEADGADRADDVAPALPMPGDGPDALPDAAPALPDVPGGTDGDPAAPAAGRAAERPGGKSSGGTRPRGRLAAPDTAQQKRIKKTLRRGLPKLLDKPLVLVSAGVTAALLGLGTGWATSLAGGGGELSAADAASCAQTQMAWTQAANAQSAMVADQPETLRKGFINARNALEGVTPPEAIAEDWAVAFTYYSTVANNIEKVKPNDGPAVASAVGGAQQELDTDAMVAASQRVQEYVASNCRG